MDLSASTTAGALVGTVTEIAPNDKMHYDVAVSGMTGSGDIIASVGAGMAHDAAGNPSAASTTADNTVAFTYVPPPALDGTVASVTADDVSSVNIPITSGTGTNRLMLVGASWNCGTNGRTISSVTFTPDGGDALDLHEIITQLGYNTSNPRYAAIWALVDPPAGAEGTVTITFSGSVSNGIMAGVANFSGVDQAAPLGTPESAAGNSTSPSVLLTELNGNELVFDHVFLGASGSSYTLTAGADQTQLWNPDYVANLRAAASIEEATGDTVTMSWTSTSNYWAVAAVPIRPAVAVGDPPVVDDIPDQTIAEGSTFATIPLDDYVSDLDNADAELTWTYSGNTDLNVSIDINRVATIEIPNPDWYGAETITFRATDPDDNYDEDAATFTVTNVNDDPYALDDEATTTEGTPVNIAVLANDSYLPDPPETLSVTGVSDPPHGESSIQPDGTVDYTPDPGFLGVDSFTYSITDGNGGTDTAEVDVTVVEHSPLGLDGAVSSGTADGVSTISVAHTTGTGTDRLMLVGISANSYNGAQTVSSVTFTPTGGSAMPLDVVGSIENEAGRLAAIYSLLNPPSGVSGTVQVTFSGSVAYGIVVGVANLAGVDQSDPFDDFASGVGTEASEMTLTVATDPDDLVFDTVFIGAATIPSLTEYAGQSALWTETVDRTGGAASLKEATGDSTVMGWTPSGGATAYFYAFAAVPVNPVPAPITFTLTYAAGSGGSLTGETSQTVAYGQNGTAVEAVPDTGYHFVKWSDDVTDNPRTDTNVTADLSVTAEFALDPYTIALEPKWNLVAAAPGTTFPSQLWRWLGPGWDSTLDPIAWEGYWCKVSEPANVVSEAYLGPKTLDLAKGWNLIGNCMNSAATLTLPAGAHVFVWDPDTGYSPATTLQPGQAAWVKVAEAGQAVLTAVDPS